MFGKRDGETEALEIADDFTMEDNPKWLAKRKQYHSDSQQFDQLTVVPINIDSCRLHAALTTPSIDGEL